MNRTTWLLDSAAAGGLARPPGEHTLRARREAPMIRFLLRFAGFWLFAAALVAAVIDGAKSIAASEAVLTPLAAAWAQLAPASLAEAQRGVEERLGQPWLWQQLSDWLLAAPAWLVLGVLGLLLMLLGRKRRRSLGEEGYI